MAAKPTKFGLEIALSKLVDQIRLSLKDASEFYFTMPRKDERTAWIIIVVTWIISITAIVVSLIRG